ncbi:IS30 family transposase [Mycoplasmopsis felifaucium]|uniref:IS30 family transposase n=1 Tax=Mycoplasmopsis felifaucium TaxID=35768 RepID=A0ABZ2RQT5_9BACT
MKFKSLNNVYCIETTVKHSYNSQIKYRSKHIHVYINDSEKDLEYANQIFYRNRLKIHFKHISITKAHKILNMMQLNYSISDISKILTISNKSIKKLIEDCTVDTLYKQTKTKLFCHKCSEQVLIVKRLSLVQKARKLAYYGTNRNIFNSKKIIQKHQEVMIAWNKEVSHYNKFKNEKDFKIKAIKISARTFLDNFDTKNWKPKLSTMYWILRKDFSRFSWDFLPYKSIGKYKTKKRPQAKRPKKYIGQNISFRSQSVDLRLGNNDYEMDTVIGNKSDKFCILTLQNRRSRYIYMAFVRRNSKDVKRGLLFIIKKYKLTIDTLTIDNGSENYLLDTIPQIKEIYHCNPYCSFEKGGIENAHRFIRRFIPKGTSMDKFTQSDMDIIQERINKIERYNIADWNYKNFKPSQLEKISNSFINM